MKAKYYPLIITVLASYLLSSCASSKLGSQKRETVVMAPLPKSDVIYAALTKLEKQDNPQTLAARTRGSRGILSAYGGGLLTMGVTAVKDMIANSKKKYTDTWTQGLSDLYFYDQPSADGPFDPVGLQFSGFSVTRNVKIDSKNFTAVKANFELNIDSLASKQIINDGVFRLKLKDFELHYSKAKVPANDKFINVDFEITFSTSYVTKDGQFYNDVPLGKFYYTLRHAPLDSTSAGYKEFYEKQRNIPITGKSFIVPRSYGYYKTNVYNLQPYYNQGNFSIAVKVTESSKNKFINEMLIKTSGIGIDYGSSFIMQEIQKKK